MESTVLEEDGVLLDGEGEREELGGRSRNMKMRRAG
jgi:hypothetical protein